MAETSSRSWLTNQTHPLKTFTNRQQILKTQINQKLRELRTVKNQSLFENLIWDTFNGASQIHQMISFPFFIPMDLNEDGVKILKTKEFWILYLIFYYEVNPARKITYILDQIDLQMSNFVPQCLDEIFQTVKEIETFQEKDFNIHKQINVPCKKKKNIKIVVLQIPKIEQSESSVIIEFESQDETFNNVENKAQDGEESNVPIIPSQIQNDEQPLRKDVFPATEESQTNEPQIQNKEIVLINKEKGFLQASEQKISVFIVEFVHVVVMKSQQEIAFTIIQHNLNDNHCSAIILITSGKYANQYGLYFYNKNKTRQNQEEDTNYYLNYLRFHKKCRTQFPIYALKPEDVKQDQ